MRRAPNLLPLVVALLSLSCGPELLPPPTQIKIEAGDKQVLIDWAPNKDALYSKLYWTSDGSDPTKDNATIFTKLTPPFVHTDLENGREYRYALASKIAEGTGELSQVYRATPHPPPRVGTLSISFELWHAPEAIGYALWIEDANGNYVDSLVHYRDYWRYRDGHMPEWESQRHSDLDGVTEASTWPGDQMSYTWDGLDVNDEAMPQGVYHIRLEINDRVTFNCMTDIEVELLGQGLVATGSNCNVAGDVNVIYTP